MRHRIWFTAVLVAALLLPARDADALWEYIRRLSGPGPFVGMNLLFPYSLSRPDLTVGLNNENLATLQMLGVDTDALSIDVMGFVSNRGHQRLVGKEFGVFLPDPLPASPNDSRTGDRPSEGPKDELSEEARKKAAEKAKEEAVDRFLKATQVDPAQPSKLSALIPKKHRDKFTQLPGEHPAQLAKDRLDVLNEMLMASKTAELRERIRHFDAGTGGFFGGFRPIPDLKPDPTSVCKCNPINNRFFTLSLGAEFALENNIPYADGFAGDKDVVWLSVYPAFEQRFKASGSGRFNLFYQVGPTVHYFKGAQFDDFWKASVRGRLGFRFREAYIGFQADYFLSAIKNEEFGAVPDPTDEEHWSAGLFFGINLTGRGR